MTKKTLIFSFLFLLTVSTGFSQVVMTPKFHQFGKIRPGKVYHLIVKLTNPTNQNLAFWNLHADCDCTNAHIDKAVIKPKTSTTLNITYHPPEGENGFKHFEVSFKVYSQEKGKKVNENTIKFLFSAELASAYVYEPAVLDGGFTLVGHAKEGHGVMKLDPKVYPHFKADSVTASVPSFAATVTAKATPGIYDVTLSIPEKARPGAYEGKIRIVGNGKSKDAFEYPFKAVVGGFWKVAPNSLDLGSLEPEKFKGWETSIQIRQVFRKPFKILKIEGIPEWFKYEVTKNSAGDCLIKWHVDVDRLKKFNKEALPEEFIIQTDLKEQGAIIIPFKANWLANNSSDAAKSTVVPTATPKIVTTPIVKKNAKH